jgi:hypothetical protein
MDDPVKLTIFLMTLFGVFGDSRKKVYLLQKVGYDILYSNVAN